MFGDELLGFLSMDKARSEFDRQLEKGENLLPSTHPAPREEPFFKFLTRRG